MLRISVTVIGIEMVTRVQILEEAVSAFLHANILYKDKWICSPSNYD